MNKLLRYALLGITLCLALASAPFAVAKAAGHQKARSVHHTRQVTYQVYVQSTHRGHKYHRRARKHRQHQSARPSISLSIHN